MRVAVLHDYLNQFGGAERVLKEILDLFPEADLYTLLYDKEKTFGLFEKNIRKTSFLDNSIVRGKHRLFIPFMPWAANALKAPHRYDLVISSTAGYGKGIHVEGDYHISYCHSPLRYAWEIDYLKDLPFAPWPLKEMVVKPIAARLRVWDKQSSNRVNQYVANSYFIARKIKSYYHRDASVIYPPVDTRTFYQELRRDVPEYYLMTGRMLYYKRFDLGILAFNRLRKKLKIVGRGPELEKLKKIANPHYVEFIPYASDAELRALYSNARALIFPQIEDFGLVAAEAQACGTPLVAFRAGGAEEIMEQGTTGVFFEEQRPESVIEAVRRLDASTFNRTYIRARAQRFAKPEFQRRMLQLVKDCGFRRV